MNNRKITMYLELKNSVINNFVREHTRNGFPPDFYKCIDGFTDYIYETCALSGGFRYQDMDNFTFMTKLEKYGLTKELIKKLSDDVYECIYRKIYPPNNYHKSKYFMNLNA